MLHFEGPEVGLSKRSFINRLPNISSLPSLIKWFPSDFNKGLVHENISNRIRIIKTN